MQSDHERVRELFLQASEIEGADKRRNFLVGICGPDQVLQRQVEEMLALEGEASNFFLPLETKQGAGATTLAMTGDTCTPQEGPGSIIGRYKLLEQIGEGGF